jgi:hypothetical protein
MFIDVFDERENIQKEERNILFDSFVHSLCLSSYLKFITVNQGCPHGGIHWLGTHL